MQLRTSPHSQHWEPLKSLVCSLRGTSPSPSPGGVHATKAVEHVRKLSPDSTMAPSSADFDRTTSSRNSVTAPRTGRWWSPAALGDHLHMAGSLWAGEADEVKGLGARTQSGKISS